MRSLSSYFSARGLEDARRLPARSFKGTLRGLVHSLLFGVSLISVQLPASGFARAVPDADTPSMPQGADTPSRGDGPVQPVPAAQPGDVSRVHFDDGRASTMPRNMHTLRSVQRMLAEHPEVLVLRIEGHADDVGDPTFNLEISKRRVRGVARWLVENGVAAERLELVACGRRYVQEGNRTTSVRAQNRRVELLVRDLAVGMEAHEQCDPIELK